MSPEKVHGRAPFDSELDGPSGDGLTRFLRGGVDGCRLWPGASRVERGDAEVVDRVGSQPSDVHKSVVARYAHFSNSFRLGVVFPVHNLLGGEKRLKPDSGGAFHRIIAILYFITKSKTLSFSLVES